jgi:hypothetical protein
MSNKLQNKSAILHEAALLLHENNLYAAVAHTAYYSCYQLLKHIWIYGMGRTQQELEALSGLAHVGFHEFLINEVGMYIKHSDKKKDINDFRIFNTSILQLKGLRISADYEDSVFDSAKSNATIKLFSLLLPVLKKYLQINYDSPCIYP